MQLRRNCAPSVLDNLDDTTFLEIEQNSDTARMAFEQVVDGLERAISRSPTLTGAAVLFAITSLIIFLVSRPKRLNLPVMGKPDSNYYGDVVLEGVAKVTRQPNRSHQAAADSIDL